MKGGTNGFALKAGDATAGPLQTMYNGPRPSGYQPMKKQGALLLGIGGDNSNSAIGTFFEGVVTSGFSADAVDDAEHVDIEAPAPVIHRQSPDRPLCLPEPDAGIVEQQVHRTEAVEDAVGERCHRSLLGDIDRQPSFGADFSNRHIEPALIDIGEHDAGPLAH